MSDGAVLTMEELFGGDVSSSSDSDSSASDGDQPAPIVAGESGTVRTHEMDADEAPAAPQQVVARVPPGYVLNDDETYAYGPRDPRRAKRMYERAKRRLAEILAPAREHDSDSEWSGASSSSSSDDDMDSSSSDDSDAFSRRPRKRSRVAECAICKLVRDINPGKGDMSVVATQIVSTLNRWKNNWSDERIDKRVAQLWNDSVYRSARFRNLSVPLMRPEDVARHRKKCIHVPTEKVLLRRNRVMNRLIQDIENKQMYRFRILPDGSMSPLPELDPAGVRLYNATVTSACRNIHEMRGTVSSVSLQNGAYVRQQETGASKQGSAAGGMRLASVQRAGGMARAPV